jgi:hypothetical protein
VNNDFVRVEFSKAGHGAWATLSHSSSDTQPMGAYKVCVHTHTHTNTHTHTQAHLCAGGPPGGPVSYTHTHTHTHTHTNLACISPSPAYAGPPLSHTHTHTHTHTHKVGMHIAIAYGNYAGPSVDQFR